MLAPADTTGLGRALQEAVLGDAVRLLPDAPVVLAPTARLHGLAWSLLPTGLTLLALQRLWVLFGEYAQGRVFSLRALSCLRGVARCVLALGGTLVLQSATSERRVAAHDFFQGLYTTALDAGEIITSVSFPIPTKAAYAKFNQPASRFALVGVFVAQTAAGARVAITGAGNGVFRHAGLEAALSKSFTPEAVTGVAVDSTDLNADLHASKAYRAHLITVQTQRAVKQANG